MSAFQLLIRGLGALFKKLPALVIVSLIPMLLMGFVIIYMLNVYDRVIGPDIWQAVTLLVGISTAAAVPLVAWAAINWQRSVLLGARPALLLHLRNLIFWSFLWRLAVLVCVFVALLVPYSYILIEVIIRKAFEAVGDIAFGIIVLGPTLAFIAFCLFLFLTFGLCLPAISENKKSTLRMGWRQSHGYRRKIVSLSILISVLLFVLLVLSAVLLPPGLIANAVALWVFISILFAALTELYRFIRAQDDAAQVFD